MRLLYADPLWKVSAAFEKTDLNLLLRGAGMKIGTVYDVQQLEEHKWINLGLESHFKASFLAQLIAPNRYWFSPYLFDNSMDDSASSFARVSIHLRAVHQAEKMVSDVGHLMDVCKAMPWFEKATHVVQEIRYGFNIVVVFDCPVSSATEKKQIEEELFLQAKNLFDRLVSGEKPAAIIKSQDLSILATATVNVYSDISLENGGSLSERLEAIQQSLKQSSNRRVPIKMVLFPIDYLAERWPIPRDLPADELASLSLFHSQLAQVGSRWSQLLRDPFLVKIPLFSAWLHEGFNSFLTQLCDRIKNSFRANVVDYRRHIISQCSFNLSDGDLLEYVMARKRDLLLLKQLLEGVDLEFSTLTELEANYRQEQVHVFYLKTRSVNDALLSNLKKTFCFPDTKSVWNCFDVLLPSTSQDISSLRNQLLEFRASNKNGLSFLSISNSFKNGFIVTKDPHPDAAVSGTDVMSTDVNTGKSSTSGRTIVKNQSSVKRFRSSAKSDGTN